MKDFFNMDNSFGLSSYHSNDEDKDKNGIKSRAVIYQTTIRMENRWKKSEWKKSLQTYLGKESLCTLLAMVLLIILH